MYSKDQFTDNISKNKDLISLSHLIQFGEQTLKVAGIEEPYRETKLLIAAALGIDLGTLLLMNKQKLVPKHTILNFISRRARHEPFAYITGYKGFWTLDLKVSNATLIPRADSETLIETMLQLLTDRTYPYQILDLGTGSGCLLLSALTEYKNAYGIGIDKVKDAVYLAKENARLLNLIDRTSFIQGDWGSAISNKFDIIFSNPPYIPHQDIHGLMPEVKDFEPHSALDGGKDGLDYYQIICKQAVDLLAENGIVILELGINQVQDVIKIAFSNGLSVVKKQHDLNGCIRALVLNHSNI